MLMSAECTGSVTTCEWCTSWES